MMNAKDFMKTEQYKNRIYRDGMKSNEIDYNEYIDKTLNTLKTLIDLRNSVVTNLPDEDVCSYAIDYITDMFESVFEDGAIDLAVKSISYAENTTFVTGLINYKNGKYMIKDIELKDGDEIEYFHSDEWFCTWWTDNSILGSDEINPIGTLARVRR